MYCMSIVVCYHHSYHSRKFAILVHCWEGLMEALFHHRLFVWIQEYFKSRNSKIILFVDLCWDPPECKVSLSTLPYPKNSYTILRIVTKFRHLLQSLDHWYMIGLTAQPTPSATESHNRWFWAMQEEAMWEHRFWSSLQQEKDCRVCSCSNVSTARNKYTMRSAP